MKLTAKEIANFLEGKVEGLEQEVVTHPGKIEEADKGAITFLANLKYETHIYTTKASVVLVADNFMPTQKIETTLIRVKDPYNSFTKYLQRYQKSVYPNNGISSLASIHSEVKLGKAVTIGDFSVLSARVKIGDNCRIYPQVFIGVGVKIGKNVILHPGVKIHHHCQIGDNCIIQSNAVIGSDGFGFAPQADGSYQKIPQLGIVRIEENVEVGANTVIDRATTGETIIKKGTKLDNLIQVAHNVTVGAHTVIAAQTGIAGSTRIGDQCQIGGQVGFVGHIQVANKVQVQAQSGVASSIKEEGSKVYGYPALSYQDYLRSYALFRKFPEIEKRIRQLEQVKK